VKHRIKVKWVFNAAGEPVFRKYECVTHGTMSFFVEGLSCVRKDDNPEIEFVKEEGGDSA